MTSTIWCGTHQITHPTKERLTTPPGSTSPNPFEQWCGFFYIPQEPGKWKCCETGPTIFHPYPRRLESLTIYRCHCKGSTFSSVKDPECWCNRGWNSPTSCSAERPSPNSANQAAVQFHIPSTVLLSFTSKLLFWEYGLKYTRRL